MTFWKKITASWSERRADWRVLVTIPASVRTLVGKQVEISIEDLTARGFRALIPIELEQGELLRIYLPIARSPYATVAWKDGNWIGCQFVAPLAEADLDALVRACA